MNGIAAQPAQRVFRMIAVIRRAWLRRQLIVFAALGLAILGAWLLVMSVLDNLAMLSTPQLALGCHRFHAHQEDAAQLVM